MIRKVILLSILFNFMAGALFASDDIRVERVQFEQGKDSAIIESSITGYNTIDYVLGARQGQSMKVSMVTNNTASYFNILESGEDQVAMFNGSINGNHYEGQLPETGDYKIRIYLMRSAARRNETAKYTLTVSITGSAEAAQPMGPAPATDAKVKGTPYHATGQLPCSMGDAPQGSMQCDFGVIRGEPGNAQVHVTPPGGFERVLTFIGEKVTSEGSTLFKASKSGDIWLIDVNEYEHYWIPDAVIIGG